MNWGYKIAGVYIAFVAFMLMLVVLCVRQKDVHLVSQDYYKEEIAYQEMIDKQHNTQALSAQVQMSYSAEKQALQLDFPEESRHATGEIWLFRPSNAHLDLKIPLSLSQKSSQEISTAELPKGFWKVKVQWQQADKVFYDEQSIVFQ